MLTEPQPFQDALDALQRKMPYGSKRKSREWASIEPEVKRRAFFSARVESVRFLQRARAFLLDYLDEAREVLPNGEIALRADSRGRFVKQMMRLAVYEGLGPLGIPADQVDHESLTDVRSEARLKLIFDTNLRQSVGFGWWTQGMDPDVLHEYPAAKFVRYPGSLEKRPRHAAHEGDIRKKTDFGYWADYQNDPQIGGFGNPYEPYGFNSNMGQEDVSRDEAIRLGLIDPKKELKRPRLPGFNDTLKASVQGLDIDLRRKLAKELGVKTPIKRNEIKPAKG